MYEELFSTVIWPPGFTSPKHTTLEELSDEADEDDEADGIHSITLAWPSPLKDEDHGVLESLHGDVLARQRNVSGC